MFPRLRNKRRKKAHRFEWAMTWNAITLQWLWTWLAWRDETVQHGASIIIGAAPKLIHTRDFYPDIPKLLLQYDICLEIDVNINIPSENFFLSLIQPGVSLSQ